MTPTEIRTALIGFRTLLANEGTAISYQTLGQYRTMLLRELDALLSALPETAPGIREALVGLREAQKAYMALRDARGGPMFHADRLETAGQAVAAAAAHADSVLAGDTGPAPPRALVEVVREWQRTRNVIQAGDSEWPHKNAEDALFTYPLPAPEAPETPR